MASFQKLDKKQVPQVIGLSVASCGLFGYFAVKMITPTASAAPLPPTHPAVAATTATPTATAAAATATVASDAPAPTLGMRDPFVPTVPLPVVATATPAAPKTAPVKVASANIGGAIPLSVPPAGLGPLPPVTPLPGVGSTTPAPASIGGVTNAPVAPANPAWTVTGVLSSGSQSIAILRDGSAREFARPGEMVDATFRVVDVTPVAVVLRHGEWHYTLPIGGAKAASQAAPQSATSGVIPPQAAALSQAPIQPPAPQTAGQTLPEPQTPTARVGGN